MISVADPIFTILATSLLFVKIRFLELAIFGTHGTLPTLATFGSKTDHAISDKRDNSTISVDEILRKYEIPANYECQRH